MPEDSGKRRHWSWPALIAAGVAGLLAGQIVRVKSRGEGEGGAQ